MQDETEAIRREMCAEINADPNNRAELESRYGQIWDTDEMCRDYQALGFMAPFVIVKRRSDDVKGSLLFQHDPRYYHSFQPQ